MNDPALQLYIALLLAGFLLLGSEIYVPGGILGLIGGLALIAAIVTGFHVEAFGAYGGMISAVAILAGLIFGLIFWLKFFPNSALGRRIGLAETGRAFTLNEVDSPSLIGAEGTTVTDLRPSGIARLGDKKCDVVADGGWIGKDRRVVVIRVAGNHLTVREIEPPDQEAS
jgi:membrane-bound serine protease (ClpP class)